MGILSNRGVLINSAPSFVINVNINVMSLVGHSFSFSGLVDIMFDMKHLFATRPLRGSQSELTLIGGIS